MRERDRRCEREREGGRKKRDIMRRFERKTKIER